MAGIAVVVVQFPLFQEMTSICSKKNADLYMLVGHLSHAKCQSDATYIVSLSEKDVFGRLFSFWSFRFLET